VVLDLPFFIDEEKPFGLEAFKKERTEVFEKLLE
jgi:hypothetical protein